MSPFSRGMPYLGGFPPGPELSRFRSPHGNYPARGFTMGAWGSSAPENPSQPSTAYPTGSAGQGSAGRQPNYSTVVGGFDQVPTSGAKSGASSRRHSVSVVGGAQGRRDIFADLGMTSPGRGIGSLGFSDEELLPERLGNALSLEIDEHRRRGVEIEVGKDRGEPAGRGRDIPKPVFGSLPSFDPLGEDGHRGLFSKSPPSNPGPVGFGSSPRGRADRPDASFQMISGDRTGSRDSKDSSGKSRFIIETPSSGVKPSGLGTSYPNTTRGNPMMPNSPPERGRDMDRRPGDSVGPIGGPPGPLGPAMDPRIFPPMYAGRSMFPNGPGQGPGPGPGPMGPPSPVMPTYGRPSSYPYGARPPPPSMGGGYGPPPSGPYGPSPQQPYSPTQGSYPYYPGPPAPSSPTQPHSPSFSSLSLSDLGKGANLNSLAPNTPLYIVAFKAGRRDVYYCPDPTLLISNGDRVIVEADRGSDLGAVIYDQLTPVDVREWQEKQATAALLSGASQHQPPGMAMGGGNMGQPKPAPRAAVSGELAGADLGVLLAGVGAQVDPSVGLGAQGRGPLAKEIMPKRMFAKSSQSPEDQA